MYGPWFQGKCRSEERSFTLWPALFLIEVVFLLARSPNGSWLTCSQHTLKSRYTLRSAESRKRCNSEVIGLTGKDGKSTGSGVWTCEAPVLGFSTPSFFIYRQDLCRDCVIYMSIVTTAREAPHSPELLILPFSTSWPYYKMETKEGERNKLKTRDSGSVMGECMAICFSHFFQWICYSLWSDFHSSAFHARKLWMIHPCSKFCYGDRSHGVTWEDMEHVSLSQGYISAAWWLLGQLSITPPLDIYLPDAWS